MREIRIRNDNIPPEVQRALAFLRLTEFGAIPAVCEMPYMADEELAEFCRNIPHLLTDISRLPEAVAVVAAHIQQRAQSLMESQP